MFAKLPLVIVTVCSMSIERRVRLIAPDNETSDKFLSNITTFEIGRILFNPAVVQLRVFYVAQMFRDIRVGSVLRG